MNKSGPLTANEAFIEMLYAQIRTASQRGESSTTVYTADEHRQHLIKRTLETGGYRVILNERDVQISWQ